MLLKLAKMLRYSHICCSVLLSIKSCLDGIAWLILLSVFVLPGNVWWYRWDITLGICAVELDGTIDVIAPHGRERWIYSPLGIFQVEYG